MDAERVTPEQKKRSPGAAEHLLFIPPLVVAVILCWVVPMWTSLGVDECGNWWVVKDGFRVMLERSRFWLGGQSVLFNSLVLAAMRLGGDSDAVLRIPAVVSSIGALYFLYRLGTRIADRSTALISCLVFVTMSEVVLVASSMRPYSLGLCLLIGAVGSLVLWCDSGRKRYGILYVVLASLTLYATFIYGTMFLIHALYVYRRRKVGTSAVAPGGLALAWCGCGVLISPLVPRILSAYSGSAGEVYLPAPDIDAFLASILPYLFAGAVCVALFVTQVLRHDEDLSTVENSFDWWFVAVWAIVPPTLLLGLSLFSELRLFAGRYYISNAPAVALAAAIVLRRVSSPSFQRGVAIALVVVAVVQYGASERFLRGEPDFRGAVAAARSLADGPGTVVLTATDFVEGDHVPDVENPRLTEALGSCLLRYRMPGRIVLLPAVGDAAAFAYLDQQLETLVRGERKFLAVGTYGTAMYQLWLDGRCRQWGFSSRAVRQSGGVFVYIFERKSVTGEWSHPELAPRNRPSVSLRCATPSMEGRFGTVAGGVYGWPKDVLHWAGIDECIADLHSLSPRAFTMVDGIVGMEGDGTARLYFQDGGLLRQCCGLRI